MLGRLLFLLVLSSYTVLALSDLIQCGPNLFCGKPMTNEWLKKRRIVNFLIQLKVYLDRNDEIYIHKNNTEVLELLEERRKMCRDSSYTAFLLDDSINIYSSSRCIWSGQGQSVACSLVPLKYFNESYISIKFEEWKRQVQTFRNLIGCQIGQEQRLEEDGSELVICSNRCIQGGVTYIVSLIIFFHFVRFFIHTLNRCVRNVDELDE